MQDAIDLLLVVAWTYANGYAFAWLIPQLGWDPHRIGSTFALIGLALRRGFRLLFHVIDRHGQVDRGAVANP